MNEGGQLIGIDEVSSLFEKSIESIRKYKNYGILKVADKVGNKAFLDSIKKYLFGNTSVRLTKKKSEEFFSQEKNFG